MKQICDIRHIQVETVLVSNISNSIYGPASTGDSRAIAQGFVTGGHPNGYKFTKAIY